MALNGRGKNMEQMKAICVRRAVELTVKDVMKEAAVLWNIFYFIAGII